MSYRFADSLRAGSGRSVHQHSTCFGQFLCPSSGVFRCTHGDAICHTGLLTACEQDQDGTPDDGQRNCPKHVEFYSKNKFEKLVHLVGFIVRIYHDARSPERQIRNLYLHNVPLKLKSFELLGNISI